jgi:hypothetical protein
MTEMMGGRLECEGLNMTVVSFKIIFFTKGGTKLCNFYAPAAGCSTVQHLIVEMTNCGYETGCIIM